jgi:hypothetical protein
LSRPHLPASPLPYLTIPSLSRADADQSAPLETEASTACLAAQPRH